MGKWRPFTITVPKSGRGWQTAEKLCPLRGKLGPFLPFFLYENGKHLITFDAMTKMATMAKNAKF